MAVDYDFWGIDKEARWPARTIAAFALVCCLAAALIGWAIWPAPIPPAGSSGPITVAAEEEIKAGPKMDLTPSRPVKVSPPTIKAPLGLPAPVQADPQQHVTATARLDAEARPYTLSAVLDDGTGDTTIYARPDPLPWFGFESTGSVGLHIGVRSDGAQVMRLSARHDIVSIKRFHAGLAGTLDSDGQLFVGIGAEWRY